MSNLTFKIQKLKCLIDYEGLKDVVEEVRLNVHLKNEKGVSACVKFIVHLNLANVHNNFVKKEDLTKDIVLSWVMENVPEKDLDDLKSQLLDILSPKEYYYEPSFAEN